MRSPFKSHSNIQKFFISLSLVFIFVIVDLHLFARKASEVERYDALSARLSNMRASTAKLEYMLDMLIVAKRFEPSTIKTISDDVASLNKDMTDLKQDPTYRPLLVGNTLVSEGVSSMVDDLENVRVETGRLNDTISQDEMMLIHNAVDIHTVLIIEKADRLMGVISESRHAIFDQTWSLEMESMAGFVLLALFVSFVYYKKLVSPMEKMVRTAEKITERRGFGRFRANQSSLMGRLGSELNTMLDSLDQQRDELDGVNTGLKDAMAGQVRNIESFSNLMASASRSLSATDVLTVALNEAVSGAGADAGAVFMCHEGGEMRPVAAAGLGPLRELPGVMAAPGEKTGPDERGRAVLYRDIRAYPDASLAEFLALRGFESMFILPILYNMERLALMVVLYRNMPLDAVSYEPFLEAIASGAAVAIGSSALFQREHGSRRFTESVINQMPFGVAVFGPDGRARMMNASVKRMLGAGRDSTPEAYTVFDDTVFARQGLVPSIKKTYEGYATEFMINYDPAVVANCEFKGPRAMLRIRSMPLYDAGGDISNIMLLYEVLPGVPGAEDEHGEAHK